MFRFHYWLESKAIGFVIAVVLVASIGGLVEIAPLFTIHQTVEEVKEVTVPGEHTALGPIAGGVAGAVLGHQVGGGNGKKIATVLGALGGALAGRHIEQQARGEKRWETVVRLEDGSQRTVQSTLQPFWHAGERVRFVDGTLQPV